MKRLTLTVFLLISGCGGHVFMRGTLVTTTSSSEGQICMFDGEMTVGDTVAIVHHTCTTSMAGNAVQRRCVASRGGSAVVVELLNEHYSIVRAAEGTELRAGDTIEPVSD